MYFFLFLASRIQRFDHFDARKQGYGQMDGGDTDAGGGQYNADDPGSPASFDEIERPPLRHVDKYCRAELPCMTHRYTVAMMTCIGFIISFGIRCNLSIAKLSLAESVSKCFN